MLKVTASPDDTVAPTVTGDWDTDLSLSAANVIAWAVFATPKLWETVGAGAKIPFPGWSAFTVHVPDVTRLIVDPCIPVAVHTGSVLVVNVTAPPDDAVAETMNDPVPRARSGSVANVMV